MVILGAFETLPEFMRRVFVLCLMCLLPLQLLADGFNFPAPAPAHSPAAENASSCPQPVVEDDLNLPMASADLSALTSPGASCLRSAVTVTLLPAYVPSIPRDLFFPVPKPPPRHDLLRFDL